jgi:hypothetical protein
MTFVFLPGNFLFCCLFCCLKDGYVKSVRGSAECGTNGRIRREACRHFDVLARPWLKIAAVVTVALPLTVSPVVAPVGLTVFWVVLVGPCRRQVIHVLAGIPNE